MADPGLDRELDVALRLAWQAGAAIMGYYQTGLAVERKAEREPVTVADREADHLIANGLRLAFPDDGFLSEESEDDRSRLEKERAWIVDPLDGTVEFITETGEFSVQIALVIQRRPVLGVVHEPAHERTFYAVKGQGAYELHDGQRTRLHVSTVAEPGEMCLVASRSHYSPLIDAARKALGVKTLNQLGSVGMKVSLVARGECDVYLATTVTKEWDVCAPHALLMEAGGILTDLDGADLVYNRPDVKVRRGLIGSNGLAHDRIVQAVSDLRDLRDLGELRTAKANDLGPGGVDQDGTVA